MEKTLRIKNLSALLLLGLLLSACAQQVESRNNANTKEKIIEIDDEITADEMRAGLKKAKYLLLQNPFLTPEEAAIADLNSYRNIISDYVEAETAVQSVQSYFYKLFNITEASADYNYLEPSNLAAKLFKANRDFREFLTADYCVEDAENSYVSGPCRSNIDGNVFVLPPEMTAGFMSTQAFLAKYAGAKNFRRISKVFEFALCSAAPSSGEPEGWIESESEMTLHPFYWDSLNQVEGMNCTSCHGAGGLNQGRIAFTPFSENGGKFLAGQEMMIGGQPQQVAALTLNDVESSLIGDPVSNPVTYQIYLDNYGPYGFDFETPFEPSTTRFFGEELANFNANPEDPENPSYPNLAQMADLMANHELFASCMSQHMFQFAKHGRPMGITHRPPKHASEYWTQKFKEKNYRLKNLLIEVLVHPVYLNL